MVDKGGKLSSNGSMKKDSKEASAKRVKAIFDSDSDDSVEVLPSGKDASPLSGGKGSSKTASFKGDKGKEAINGKTGKVGEKGGAAFGSKSAPKIAELSLKDIPKDARCLMDCEVASILAEVARHLPSLSDDPAVKLPEVFPKAREYAVSGDHYESSEDARKELNKLKQIKVSDGEICIFGNACPDTIDEVYALLPMLKAKVKAEGSIKTALSSLEKLKKSKEEFSFPDPPS